MSSLIFKKRNISKISVVYGISNYFIFLGGSNNTIGTFLNSAELTGNNNQTLADRILIYNQNTQLFTTYFLRGDGVTWRIPGSTISQNNTIIPNNSIFALASNSNKTFTMQGTNIIQKSNSGQTSIKKQNLTKLKSGNFFNQQESIYIFRSATNNTLAQIFNLNQFEAYSDSLSLYDENFNLFLINGGLNGSIFFTDGSSWLYDDFTTNADNYVIPANTILAFGTTINFDINAGGGAIIEKYYSGKLNARKAASAPSGIPVASTNNINLNNALAYYQSYFGLGYFIGNPQSFSKIDSNTYFDGSVNYIRYIGYWQWYWDNNDNSYGLINLTSATDPNFIPNNWGNGITITAA